jgi:hypothetical protein
VTKHGLRHCRYLYTPFDPVMKLTTIGEFSNCLRTHSIGTLPKRWRSSQCDDRRLHVSGDMDLAMQLQSLFPTLEA